MKTIAAFGCLLSIALAAVGCAGDPDDSADESASAITSRTEQDLDTETKRAKVVSGFERNCAPGEFKASARTHYKPNEPYIIHYHKCPATGKKKGTFVVVPGTTEASIRYAEFAADWTARGYDLFLLNNRGEGYNERLLPDDPKTKGVDESERRHMDNFADFVTDLKDFVDTSLPKDSGKPGKLMLVCHSLGGGICTRYAEVNKKSIPFDGLILSAPMHGLILPIKEELQSTVLTGSLLLSESFAHGKKTFDLEDPFEGNTLTGSRNRFELRRYIYKNNPKVRLGGPTWGWTQRALFATQELRNDAGQIEKPMLILSAELDEIVKSHELVYNGLRPEVKAKSKHVTLKGSKHEIFGESDGIRNKAFTEMENFIKGL